MRRSSMLAAPRANTARAPTEPSPRAGYGGTSPGVYVKLTPVGVELFV